jgi:hypothetical protein
VQRGEDQERMKRGRLSKAYSKESLRSGCKKGSNRRGGAQERN